MATKYVNKINRAKYLRKTRSLKKSNEDIEKNRVERAKKQRIRMQSLSSDAIIEYRNKRNLSKKNLNLSLNDEERIKRKTVRDKAEMASLQLLTASQQQQRKQVLSAKKSTSNSAKKMDALLNSIRFDGNEYFEHQESRLCGLHALNNALQIQLFSRAELFEIAESQKTQEKSVQIDQSIVNIYSTADGDFNITVLIEAVNKKGFNMEYCTIDDVERFIQTNNLPVGRYILNQNDHYVCIIRFSNFERPFLFDSVRQKPEQITNLVSFYGFRFFYDRSQSNYASLLVIRNFEINNFNGQYYLERQVSRLCGLHALNNAFQAQMFTKRELFDIAQSQKDRAVLIYGQHTVSSVSSNSISSSHEGDFNITVLIAAANNKGLNLDYCRIDELAGYLQTNNLPVGRYILNQNDHYVAIIRFSNVERPYLFDSMRQKSDLIENLSSFYGFRLFADTIKKKSSTLLQFRKITVKSYDQLLGELRASSSTNVTPSTTNQLKRPRQSSPNPQNPKKKNLKTQDTTQIARIETDIDKIMNEYETNIAAWKMILCNTCYEISYINTASHIIPFKCRSCRASNKKKPAFYSLNEHDPKPIPDQLLNDWPTFFEEQLIAAVFVSQFVYVRNSGTHATKGHCINFAQNVSAVADVFPRLPEDVPLVVIECRDRSGSLSQEFTVRRAVIRKWLEWLQKHSQVPVYKNMVIDESRLLKLPENGPISGVRTIIFEPSEFTALIEENESSEMSEESASYDGNHLHESGFPLPLSREQSDIDASKGILNNILARMPFPDRSSEPLSEFSTAYLAAMAFPTLFPYGTGDPFTYSRNSSEMTKLDKIKHLLRYGEQRGNRIYGRFASHARFCLWINNLYYRHRTLSQGDIYLSQKLGDANLSAERLRQMVADPSKANPVLNNMRRYMANIPGTPSYWFTVSCKLKAMIDSKGPPHLFFTFSFPDLFCPFLKSFLGLAADSSKDETKKAVKENPQSVNWFFLQRFNEFKTVWLEKALMGTVQNGGWYFYRFEFQNRGALHVHGLIRMGGDVPNTYELADKAIKAFRIKKEKKGNYSSQDLLDMAEYEPSIKALEDFQDKFICTDISSKYSDFILPQSRIPKQPQPMTLKPSEVTDVQADSLDLSVILQRHICIIGQCVKGQNQECRFNYPKNQNDKTKFKVVEKTLANGTTMYELELEAKRSNDTRIINHNVDQLRYWRGNCDCSMLFDARRVIAYVTKYATKPEQRSNTFATAFSSVINETTIDATDTAVALRRVMTSVLAERDISHQEALHQTLGFHLYDSNLTVVNVSLEPSKRVNKILENNEIEYDTSFVELYADRVKLFSPHMSGLNFTEFATQYEFINGNLKQRKNSSNIVLRFFQKFSSNPTNDTFELYCKYQLLRYKPWQFTHEDALEGQTDWALAWKGFLDTEYARKIVNNWSEELMEIAEDYISDNDISIDGLLGELDQEEMDDEKKLHPDFISNMPQEPISLNDVSPDSRDYWNSIRNLYSEEEIREFSTWLQKRKAEKSSDSCEDAAVQDPFVTDIPEQQLAYDIVQDWYSNRKHGQLLMRLEGPGGTGKSYVINGVKRMCGKHCVIGAPTGKAARNINGSTLHSLLHLPVRSENLAKLSGLKLQSLQATFPTSTVGKNTYSDRILVIDEYSMLGCRLFNLVDQRLRQATGNLQELFGGVSVILGGDPMQLPPVKDCVLWKPIDSTSSASVVSGHVAYKAFVNVIELVTNVRVKSDDQDRFREAIGRLRMGESIYEDWLLFQTRFVGHVYNPLDIKRFDNAVRIFERNNQVNAYNSIKLLELLARGHKIARIESKNTGYGSDMTPAEYFGGLEPHFCLANGAQVMITANYWVTAGLVNGTTCKVKYIIYEQDCVPPVLPQIILLEMDEEYDGPSLDNHPRIIPLPVRSVNCDGTRGMMERQQYGLRPAFAITIHKVQGQTLEKAYVDIGEKAESHHGLTYVAMSRVRRLEDMFLAPFDFTRIEKIKLPKYMTQFIMETKQLIENTRIKFAHLIRK